MSFIKSALVLIVLSLTGLSCELATEKTSDGTVKLPEKLTFPSVNKTKPKIVAFGDSLTAGFGLSEKESYPYLLQKQLEQDGFNYEVINAGVSGDTSLGGLERIDWVLGQDNIEIIIIELGANDLLRGVPVAEMKKNLEEIIIKSKKAGVDILFCGMLAPPTMGKNYQRDYVNVFPDLASKYDLPFLPFLLENIALEKDLNQPDGIHPNAKGSVIMTSNIYKELKPLLDK